MRAGLCREIFQNPPAVGSFFRGIFEWKGRLSAMAKMCRRQDAMRWGSSPRSSRISTTMSCSARTGTMGISISRHAAARPWSRSWRRVSRTSRFSVTFEPGCRSNWHTHHAGKGGGQTLSCVAGRGYRQARGEPARVAPRRLREHTSRRQALAWRCTRQPVPASGDRGSRRGLLGEVARARGRRGMRDAAVRWTEGEPSVHRGSSIPFHPSTSPAAAPRARRSSTRPPW